MNTVEVAKYIGVSDFTVKRWMKIGVAPVPEREGRHGVAHYFKKETVDEWIEENQERIKATKKRRRYRGFEKQAGSDVNPSWLERIVTTRPWTHTGLSELRT